MVEFEQEFARLRAIVQRHLQGRDPADFKVPARPPTTPSDLDRLPRLLPRDAEAYPNRSSIPEAPQSPRLPISPLRTAPVSAFPPSRGGPADPQPAHLPTAEPRLEELSPPFTPIDQVPGDKGIRGGWGVLAIITPWISRKLAGVMRWRR